MQTGHARAAIPLLRALAGARWHGELYHASVRVRPLALLRLAQAHDLARSRGSAVTIYQRLVRSCRLKPIREAAASGLGQPFRLTEPAKQALLRDYALNHPFAEQDKVRRGWGQPRRLMP